MGRGTHSDTLQLPQDLLILFYVLLEGSGKGEMETKGQGKKVRLGGMMLNLQTFNKKFKNLHLEQNKNKKDVLYESEE